MTLTTVTLPLNSSLLDSPSVCHFRGKMQLLDFCLILLLNAGRVAAQSEASGNVCYILDGILIIYGIVLTVLYCRLKMTSSQSSFAKVRSYSSVSVVALFLLILVAILLFLFF